MNSKRWNRIALTFAAILAAASTLWGNSGADYQLLHKYEFGAAPGGREYFDYITVDPESRRVYLSHGTEVLVVNADTGALEGKISGLKQSHGVAVVPASGRGFISDGAQGKAIIFDLKTLKVVGEANAAPDADCITVPRRSRSIRISELC